MASWRVICCCFTSSRRDTACDNNHFVHAAATTAAQLITPRVRSLAGQSDAAMQSLSLHGSGPNTASINKSTLDLYARPTSKKAFSFELMNMCGEILSHNTTMANKIINHAYSDCYMKFSLVYYSLVLLRPRKLYGSKSTREFNFFIDEDSYVKKIMNRKNPLSLIRQAHV